MNRKCFYLPQKLPTSTPKADAEATVAKRQQSLHCRHFFCYTHE